MRHLWIALLLLPAAAPAHATAFGGPREDPGTRTYGVDPGPVQDPVAVLPVTAGRLEMFSSTPAGPGSRQPDLQGMRDGAARAAASAAARFRWRATDVTARAFQHRLTLTRTGLLSSHTTACPPPAEG